MAQSGSGVASCWRPRATWDDWSKTSTKFDAADQDRVWASFHVERNESVITIATVYHMANERGWTPTVNATEPFLNGRPTGANLGIADQVNDAIKRGGKAADKPPELRPAQLTNGDNLVEERTDWAW